MCKKKRLKKKILNTISDYNRTIKLITLLVYKGFKIYIGHK